jgi:hypothetical protein
MNVRGITISVNYADLLAITLPRNMRHLTECLVITTADDVQTQRIAAVVPGVRTYITDAFTRYGAYFNKGLAMEEGFEVLGRSGQILIWDADCLFPQSIPWGLLKVNALNGAHRRICTPVTRWSDGCNWDEFPPHADGGPIGFFQCFCADDLNGKRPWYHVGYPHAGGCDAYFIGHWEASRRHVLPFHVLHLGQVDQHWFGTSAEARDRMGAYVHRMGWRGAMRLHHRSCEERVGPLIERVEVPGYPNSDFMMPFERRMKGRRS